MLELRLPTRDGGLETYRLQGQPLHIEKRPPARSRVAYAAAHVVADPWQDVDPSSACAVDWEATIAYRRHLWSLGLAVAEAMDTAQRGMGLNWEACQELIRLSIAEAEACGGQVACGAGTDHISAGPGVTLADIERAYLEQCGFIEGLGGRVILMASRALAKVAQGPEDYVRVYGRVLDEVSQPVIVHWLGDMFDPALENYWGHKDPLRAMDVCLDVIHRHADKIDGIKISLLNANLEIQMRRQLPENVRMYTGDDFHYPELILGQGGSYSHALLGIFDAIAPAASAALYALDAGDVEGYQRILAPTVPLSRHIFRAPTRFYKTGVVFLSYLNGYQSHFRMVGGMESMRSVPHLAELFRLADVAGLLRDPELAVHRMQQVLAVAGVESWTVSI
ncbi:MAG: dihydrodipicolinate synthase family protein [Alicyclobacillus herbarius]|uniref:dihydrodipicolinate synthase family protein n=1 Tax=Alicyclobacillus herbarius TaxID=122960 RepID=UPI0023522B75|nr:dihydrodipicolinate synthase family protein [Alicyclobacillus herbarius]MCL6633144.1 dihydrodipicolinate synthase family protein [Alicyclobacillus herbarius]